MLYLHHGNDIDILKDQLLAHLQTGNGRVFEAEQILVQNVGMKRWLQQQVADCCSVAANIEFPLPSRFIWDLYQAQTGSAPALDTYDRDVLRWVLFDLLLTHQSSTNQSVMQAYLQQDDVGLARLQLAQKLADQFNRYQVYRPDMIMRWEQKRATALSASNEAWQAELWRALREFLPQPHRAMLLQQMIERFAAKQIDSANLPSRLFVFALSALSPHYLQLLAGLSTLVDVHVFVVNPCRHYWGDILSRKQQLRKGLPLQAENELLASLGSQGRDFIDQFYDLQIPMSESEHFANPVKVTLLQVLKSNLLDFGKQTWPQDQAVDDSIQVVSCYSELRELQVLHDYLLDRLNADHELQPHDIVVMCPDINTMAPYIDAVFGQQREQNRIPYSVSDHDQHTVSPLLQALLDWMVLPGCRYTVSQVLGWLEIPALRRSYDLAEADIETLRFWIKSNHVHWGLDSAHRKTLGFAAESINTWKHGIHRLLSAYLMSPTTEIFSDRVLADSVISTSEFQALGQLHKLLDDLATWEQRLTGEKTLTEWQAMTNGLIDRLLRPDEDEEWMLSQVREELATWRHQANQANCEPRLSGSVVRSLLQQALQEKVAQHHYLTGTVNFCNLIPMRTLPFKYVCLVGMGDENFPRTGIIPQLDLLSQAPRRGDPTRRDDDRYMFLQSILSAGDAVYISYVGRDQNDNGAREPSVVIRELLDYLKYDMECDLATRQTSLHPFSIENYQTGSYSTLWYPSVGKKTSIQPATSFDFEPIREVAVNELISFFSNPARYFYRDILGLKLASIEESLHDDENFSLDALQQYQLKEWSVNQRLGGEAMDDRRLRLSGELLPGQSGVLQQLQIETQTEQILHKLNSDENFASARNLQVSLSVNDVQIKGEIVTYSKQGLMQFTVARKSGRRLLALWIRHCLLNAAGITEPSRLHFIDKTAQFAPLQINHARELVARYISCFKHGNQRPLFFYPNAAFDVQQAIFNGTGAEDAMQKIRNAWSDGFQPSAEAEDPYTTLMVGDEDPFNAEFQQLSTELIKPMVEALHI